MKAETDLINMQEHFLVSLGDALEGQREWARARECGKKAFALREELVVSGDNMNALRRDDMDLLREGKYFDAWFRMRDAVVFYINLLKEGGIDYLQIHELMPTMHTIKVWAEACFLTPVKEFTARNLSDFEPFAGMALADVAETEAIIAGYEEAVLEETRREAREARTAAARGIGATAEGEEKAVAWTGKSKAAKR